MISIKSASIFAIISLPFLSACTSVPISAFQSTYNDTRNTKPHRFESLQDTDAAIGCIMRNFDSKLAAFSPTVSPAPSTASPREIRVRTSEAGMAAIIEVNNYKNGSEITIWVSNHYPLKGTLAGIMANNC